VRSGGGDEHLERERRLEAREQCVGVAGAAASAAWLAFVAATAGNVNHGGTPGLSRYATWFIPLAIPLFQ